MSNYGIKIGENISTDTDKELDFLSKYSSLKFYKWGNAQFTTNGSGVGTVSIAHGLDYRPMSIVFRKHTAQWSSPETVLPTTSYSNAFSHLGTFNWYAGGELNSIFEINVDDTNLIIKTKSGEAAANSTTYYFRYYILVDLSEDFSSASGVTNTKNYGFKVSKPSKSVLSGEEYDMGYSSKYKSLQYYSEYFRNDNLTLPIMWADKFDTQVEEANYIDFEHGLGYAPFYLAYYENSDGNYVPVPFSMYYSDVTAYDGGIEWNISGFSDASRVRIAWWRGSEYSGGIKASWTADTVNIRCLIFTENLAGAAS